MGTQVGTCPAFFILLMFVFVAFIVCFLPCCSLWVNKDVYTSPQMLAAPKFLRLDDEECRHSELCFDVCILSNQIKTKFDMRVGTSRNSSSRFSTKSVLGYRRSRWSKITFSHIQGWLMACRPTTARCYCICGEKIRIRLTLFCL